MGKKLAGSASHALATRKIEDDGTLGPYTWKTYAKVETYVTSLSKAFVNLELSPEADEASGRHRFMGLYSKNREEWIMIDLASAKAGITVVPLYDTLGVESTNFILNQTGLTTIAGSGECLHKLIEIIQQCPKIKNLISFDKLSQEDIDILKARNINLYMFKEAIKIGETANVTVVPGNLDTLATICYTSGTTGMPKGVMLSNSNFISTIAGAVKGPLSWKSVEISSLDRHFSYLPLAHVFERLFMHLCLNRGAHVGFYSGDTLKLLDDLKLFQPTVFISVPRLFNRIFDRIFAGVKEKPSMAQWLFRKDLKDKLDRRVRNGAYQNVWWDTLVFKKIKANLGGNVRFMINGAAPLDVDVQEHMNIFFSAPLVSGYGMTETVAASWIACPGDPNLGHIGSVFPCLEYKLQSVREMNYDATSPTAPKGEILVRGPCIFQGYYKIPEETSKAFENGWFTTGDIGEINSKTGSLKIIDRKKNIFKLAQGEYVAPEKIEGVYGQAGLIGQIFVTGSSTGTFLVAVVVPEEDATKKWGAANNMGSDYATIAQSGELKKAVVQQMTQAGVTGGLNGFEKVKEIHITPELFTVENDLITPTFKLRRKQIVDRYEVDIQRMYAAGKS